MIFLIVEIVLVLLVLWTAAAGFVLLRNEGLSGRQAALYVPLKLLFGIKDRDMAVTRQAEPPVIYVVWHQSQLDPALMLSLLPDDTLHILDEGSAHSPWLEPWRTLARCIEFKAQHVFVSRRLVQRLKGNGRLAVYMPDDTKPDTKAFRLFRAVAHIAARADARVVPVFVARGGFLSGRTAKTLPPMTIDQLIAHSGDRKMRASQALFSRMVEARGEAKAEAAAEA